MRMHTVLLAVVVAAVGSVALLAASTAGAQSQEGQPTTITVDPVQQEAGKPAVLTAHVTDKNGKGLASIALRFYVLTEPFGEKYLKVGEVTSDGQGKGSVSWKPTWVGDIKTLVIFAGNKDYAQSRAEGQLKAVGPVTPHENAQFGLQTVRDIAPVAVAAIVGVVWLTFIVIIGLVVVAVRSDGKAAVSEHEGGTA
jgi:hypothetical protein